MIVKMLLILESAAFAAAMFIHGTVTIQIDGEFMKGVGIVIGALAMAYTTFMTTRAAAKIGKVEQKVAVVTKKVEDVDTKVSTTNNRNIGTLTEDLETARIKDKIARGEPLEAFESSHMRTVEETEDVVARPTAHAIKPPRPKVPDAPDMKRSTETPQEK